MLISLNGGATGYWLANNTTYANADPKMTPCGLELRDTTGSTASLAVIWAGATSYFSERPTVDLLGKSDYTIATGAPKRVDSLLGNVEGFVPGHNEWDYDYSIGQLQPDVVVQVWPCGDADPRLTQLFHAHGYVPLGQSVVGRAGSKQISFDRLTSAKLSTCRGNRILVDISGACGKTFCSSWTPNIWHFIGFLPTIARPIVIDCGSPSPAAASRCVVLRITASRMPRLRPCIIYRAH